MSLFFSSDTTVVATGSQGTENKASVWEKSYFLCYLSNYHFFNVLHVLDSVADTSSKNINKILPLPFYYSVCEGWGRGRLLWARTLSLQCV